MLLAELEVWHSRPFAPTRRVALGHLILPPEPHPGFGGVLLAGVVAAYLPDVSPDLVRDLHHLVNEVERGQRVAQPRLRHRFQVDRHGLSRSTHRLVGDVDQIGFDLQCHGTPLQQVLGAVYAAERLATEHRHAVAVALHRAMRWHGPVGPDFIAFVTGRHGTQTRSLYAMADPLRWAKLTLGFDVDDGADRGRPSKHEVMAMFRARLREVHPDHGGDEDVASKMIGDLAEARRILLSETSQQ
ncbi:MAG TPA: hypothetical protein VF855_04965 [Acidimicrobiales bacterium]